MDASQVIERLGGPAALAKRLGASRTAAYNWRHTGIPAKFWIEVQRIAEQAREDIPISAICWRPHRVRRQTSPQPSEAA